MLTFSIIWSWQNRKGYNIVNQKRNYITPLQIFHCSFVFSEKVCRSHISPFIFKQLNRRYCSHALLHGKAGRLGLGL